jgi:uncharacterized peroxidase-related enzyme
MSRLEPVAREALAPDCVMPLKTAERMMGFTPTDALIMARHPRLLCAFAALVEAVYGPGKVDGGLKRLIGEATSKAAGCFYCSAHAAKGAFDQGVPAAKIAAVWSFADSPLFSAAERAAIGVAMKAGLSPNEVANTDFEDLKRHFADDEIVEIVAVIAMFGFLNRWNSTLAVALEETPGSSIARLGLA